MGQLRTIISTALLASAILATGCSKKHGDDSSGKAVEPAAAAAKKPLDAAFFGKKVAPVGLLAKVAWGSTENEVKTAAPGLFGKDGKPHLAPDEAVDQVSYSLDLDKESKTVHGLYAEVPKSAPALIDAAWGVGKDGKDTIGKPLRFWFDPATGWRAYTEAGFGDSLYLQFQKYIPAAALLGDGPDTLGFAPQGILGATIADLSARYADTLVVTDAAKAAAEQKQVSNMAGRDLAKELGEAKPSVRLDLPPTEWGRFFTRIQIDWSDDGKVADVWFDLPYEAYGPAKDEIKALLDKKWGAPTEGEQYGKKRWIYRAASPSVIVEDDTISKAWNVRIAVKPAKD